MKKLFFLAATMCAAVSLNAKNGLVLKFAENLTFKGCTIRARNENETERCKNILYNGKDLLADE